VGLVGECEVLLSRPRVLGVEDGDDPVDGLGRTDGVVGGRLVGQRRGDGEVDGPGCSLISRGMT
jgi:hypothetical protein